MLYPRIIPCLLIKDKGLVKTVNFDKYKYIGDQLNAVKIFNEKSIKEHIIKKFIYSESDNYATTTLHDTITNSTDNYKYIDFFHYHSREKTVSKTVFNLYDSSLLLPGYLNNFIRSFNTPK